MATSPSKPALAKQLKEHLQEQQEPFNLSTYLSGRQNSLKKSSSNGENNSSLGNHTCNLKESCSLTLRKKHIFYSPRSLKSLLYKLITPNEKQESSACNNKAVQEKLVSETMDMIQHIAETNWFSTSNNVSLFGAGLDYGSGSLVAETSQALNVKHSKQEKVRN
ncbi:hypothetical protein WN944_028602 [Citrus x changshan-huyou]|uniref:Uncharacterized protein n=1 Tax=Citrus x changshan-huyou TaxID=2935761 RepID=A0AAP0Q9K0_9ROSI